MSKRKLESENVQPDNIVPDSRKRLRQPKQRLTLAQKKSEQVCRLAEAYLADFKAVLGKKAPILQSCYDAAFILAQEECGSAINIREDGLLLTCCHCVENPQQRMEVISSSGQLYKAKCVAFDAKMDCALLKLLAPSTNKPLLGLPAVNIAQAPPKSGDRVFCVGQPGQEDLESAEAGATNYPLVNTSLGKIRGYVAGQDPLDNEDIGACKHDAWTYWGTMQRFCSPQMNTHNDLYLAGHSGAGLINLQGELVAMHSSWDEDTAMRHAVPQQAIAAFLSRELDKLSDSRQ